MSEDNQLLSASYRIELIRNRRAYTLQGSVHKPWKRQLILLSLLRVQMEY